MSYLQGQKTISKQKKQVDAQSRRPTTVVFFDWFSQLILFALIEPPPDLLICRDDTLLPSTVLISNGITLQTPYISDAIQSELAPLQERIISILDALKKQIKYFYIVTNAEV